MSQIWHAATTEPARPADAPGAAPSEAVPIHPPAFAADRAWHAAAVLVIGALTLILVLLAERVSGHESVALGTIADRVYVTDGFFDPEQNAALGAYRWTEPLAKLTLWDWGPGPVRVRVSGVAAGTQPNDITLKLGDATLGHTVAAPDQPWTVEGTGQTGARNPVFTLEGPRLETPGDARLLGRLVTRLEIDAPAARDRALLNLGLLALAGLLLYAAVGRWTGHPGLALLAGAATPAVFGLFAVYRDRWLDTVAWTAPLALGVALLVDSRWQPPARLRRLGGGAAVVALAAALLLLAQGVSNAFDSDLMVRMAAGWVEYGEPTKYPTHSWSKYGFGLPLAAVPFYGLGKAALVFGGNAELLTTFTVSLTNLVLTALLAWVLYRAERRFMSAPIALAGVATFLLATPALNYARTFFSEPLGALLLLLGLLLLVPRRDARVPALGRIFLSGICLGAMIWIKPAFAVYLPVPGLLVLGLAILDFRFGILAEPGQTGASAPKSKIRNLKSVAAAVAAFAVGPLLGLAGQLAYNAVRYGNWLSNGYEKEAGFSTPLLEGLGGLLLSPGKSLLLYAPVVLLAVPACWVLARRGGLPGRVAVLLIAGETGAGLVLNAMWWAWTGNFAWGPRLIVPLLPLLVWPVGALLDGPARIVAARGRQVAAGAWVALGALGALVSIPGALVDFQVYYGLRGLWLAGLPEEAPTIYDPAQSPLLVEPGYLLDGLTAAIRRPTLAQTGLPPAWDTFVPAALTLLAILALWLAARAAARPRAEPHPRR
jgi:hypothetical protein